MAEQTETYGVGVQAAIKGDKLLISIDLTESHGLSGSGKNVIVASTQGNQSIAFNNQLIKLGVNVFRTPTPAEAKAALNVA